MPVSYTHLDVYKRQSAPCAPAAAVLSALAISFAQQGIAASAVVLMLGLIGLMSGAFQIGLGLIGVGRLIRFIPFPVVSGYLSGVGPVSYTHLDVYKRQLPQPMPHQVMQPYHGEHGYQDSHHDKRPGYREKKSIWKELFD